MENKPDFFHFFCFRFSSVSLVALLICSIFKAAVAAPLSAPQPKSKKDYNYSNGQVGSNNKGLSAAEAGDIDESRLPLDTPRLRGARVSESLRVETEPPDVAPQEVKSLNAKPLDTKPAEARPTAPHPQLTPSSPAPKAAF